jgi:hypothetical protein
VHPVSNGTGWIFVEGEAKGLGIPFVPTRTAVIVEQKQICYTQDCINIGCKRSHVEEQDTGRWTQFLLAEIDDRQEFLGQCVLQVVVYTVIVQV